MSPPERWGYQAKKSETIQLLERLRGGPLTFGALVRSIGGTDELTQEEVAAKVGVSKHHVSDVDAFLVTLYWYDARHGTGGELDDIDVSLYDGDTHLRTSNSVDNKERIFYADPPHGKRTPVVWL